MWKRTWSIITWQYKRIHGLGTFGNWYKDVMFQKMKTICTTNQINQNYLNILAKLNLLQKDLIL